MNKNLIEGTRIAISGDSKDLWIENYNVRIVSEGTILSTPSSHAKKVLVCIDSIDGENNVTAFVRRSRISAC